MGRSNSIKKLIETIKSTSSSKKKMKDQLKDIEKQAQRVKKTHQSLNVFYEENHYTHTPLSQAVRSGSLVSFQKLIELGAELFYKPKPEEPSAMDILLDDYFAYHPNPNTKLLFEWVMKDKESPVFNWPKLEENESLFEKFKQANLIPKKRYINQLPIHVAIQEGRRDLVEEIIAAAGSLQKAGEFSRMSILEPAIQSAIEGRENALGMLEYLLQQGASPQTTNFINLPAIMQILSSDKVNEQATINVIQLMLNYGASIDIINPNNGITLLMAAMMRGDNALFAFLLEKAEASTLNHKATQSPDYLIFQLFNRYNKRLRNLDILKLLSDLKDKGLEFNKTINHLIFVDPFGNNFPGEKKQVFGNSMSVLHYYVEMLVDPNNHPLDSIEKHLEIIQSLIANGAEPDVKATFTMTTEVRGEPSTRPKEVKTDMELTASDYLRNIADQIVVGSNRYDSSGYLIKTYKDENEFLNNISHESREEQTRLHKQFHDFRNLERALSGKNPLPYAGLPNPEKMQAHVVNRQNPQTTEQVLHNPGMAEEDHSGERINSDDVLVMEPDRLQNIKEDLIDARRNSDKDEWQNLKKLLVNHVTSSASCEEFLERVETFKDPLQLHYDLKTDTSGNIVTGSIMYRLFHVFDTHKFPTSWEKIRKFGKDEYGIDINSQYDQKAQPKL